MIQNVAQKSKQNYLKKANKKATSQQKMDKTNDQMAQQIKSETIVLVEKASNSKWRWRKPIKDKVEHWKPSHTIAIAKKNQEKAIIDYKQKVMI